MLLQLTEGGPRLAVQIAESDEAGLAVVDVTIENRGTVRLEEIRFSIPPHGIQELSLTPEPWEVGLSTHPDWSITFVSPPGTGLAPGDPAVTAAQ